MTMLTTLTCDDCGADIGYAEYEEYSREVFCEDCTTECSHCERRVRDEDDLVAMPCGDRYCEQCIPDLITPAAALGVIMDVLRNEAGTDELPEFTELEMDHAGAVRVEVYGVTLRLTVERL